MGNTPGPLLVAIALAAALPGCEDGPYGAPPGDFLCGQYACSLTNQYCVEAPGADGGAVVGNCAYTPPACNGLMADCACVATGCQGAARGTCAVASDGSVTLTCPR